jgi:hypothetical protein
MKPSLVFPLVLLLAAPVAHAQTNPIFGALQSVQSAINQTKKLLPPTPESNAASDAQQSMSEKEKQAQQASAQQSAAAQAQWQAQTQQRMEAQKTSDLRYGTGSAGYASDQAAIQASNQRDAQRQQQAVTQARSMPSPCPSVSSKLPDGAYIVACKNAGATEKQMMVLVGALPMVAQGLFTDIVQDVYDNHVTDQEKGNAIAK